jgi:hypothetical protein
MAFAITRRALLRFGVTVPFWSGPTSAWAWPRLGHALPGAGRARACILLYMEGGPSQIDTFDPKPGRPTGGPFTAIETAVSGMRFSEHLPRLARQARRLAVIRSLTSREGNHDRARHLMHTGYPPQGGIDHPAWGSVVAADRGRQGIPGYVAIGGPGEDAGFLGAAYSPLPILNPKKPARNLAPARGVDDAHFSARAELWRTLQAEFGASHPGPTASGLRDVGEQALALTKSAGVAAFDLTRAPEHARRAYGDSVFGAGCLMARRLVAEGVPFIEVMLRGWDTHDDNFPRVKQLSATLDQAMGALLDDLAGQGLLDSTLVVWLGDFGRTPVINSRGGRDHFPAASAAVLAGGGVRGGQVVGATSIDGTEIVERPVTVPDLYRTLAAAMSVDADKARFAPSGRPIKTVDGGRLLAELF